jgi:aryl-alcohol dehydrogenase-like predicted oxidoreductase
MFRDIEKPMEPFCVKYGMGMNSYFPLAGGLLTGKYPPPAYFGMERSLPGFESLPLRHKFKKPLFGGYF